MRRTVVIITLLFVLAAVVLSACAQPGATTQSRRPTNQQMSQAKQELSKLAEGRWQSSLVNWSVNSNRVIISVVASPNADQAAVDDYCDIINGVVRENFTRFNVSASVTAGGEKTVCE